MRARSPAITAIVAIRASTPSIPIPSSFLGLSTEYWTLPVDLRHISLFGRVVSLLHVPGDPPLVLRIGGDSSDHTFYVTTARRRPRWVFPLTPASVARGLRVARDLHLRVIIDLNVITATPGLTRAAVAEAERLLPPGTIVGYEIGNEPDLYSRPFWRRMFEAGQFGARALPRRLTPVSYAAAYERYAGLIAQVAPSVPLLAPALANPDAGLRWIRTLLAGPHPGLEVITAHRYPYSACARPGSQHFPTIERLLSERATAGMADTVKPMVRLARTAGMTARLTEINSVTCGGVPGISNSFATALWAPDALFELVRTGVVGVNLHARQNTINGPFTFDAAGLQARPLLYGLIVFTRTLGPDARLLAPTLRIPRSVPLKVWAVEISGNRLHVLLINKGQRAVTVSLRLPARGPATLERLRAPSVSATTGETLAGQSLDADGAWTGAPRIGIIAPRAGDYVVSAAPYSATLLSVPTAWLGPGGE